MTDNITQKNKSVWHYLTVVGTALIIFITVGMAQNSIGILIQPVADYFDIGRGVVSTYITVQGYTLMVCYLFAGKIMAAISGRIWMPLGICSGAFGFLFISQAQTFNMFYIAAFFTGFCMSMCGGLFAGVMINRWFNKSAATFLGLTMMIPQLAGVIWSPVGAVIVANNSWRAGYLAIGGSLLVVGLIMTIFVLRAKPEERGLVPYGATQEEMAQMGEDGAVKMPGLTIKMALKTPPLWLTFCITICAGFVLAFGVAVPGYASSLGEGPVVAGLASSATLFGGAISRGTWGWVMDRIGGPRTTQLYCGIAIIGGVLVVLHPSTTIFLIGVFMFGLSFGLTLVQTVMSIRQNTGMHSFSVLNGWNNSVMALGYYSAIPLYGFIYDAYGSYDKGAYLFFTALVLCIVFCFLAYRAGAKYKQCWITEK